MAAKGDRQGRMIHIRLPEEVHKRMRIHVAKLDTTMQNWVANLVERELDATQTLNEEKQHGPKTPSR